MRSTLFIGGCPADAAQLYRVAFFLFLAFVAIAPLAHFARLHGVRRTWAFITPIVPSLGSYLTGLVFYVTHFPECCVRTRWADTLGGGSHAIWHVLIVRAIYQHKTGMRAMRGGFA
jgi:adiponectin receptor